MRLIKTLLLAGLVAFTAGLIAASHGFGQPLTPQQRAFGEIGPLTGRTGSDIFDTAARAGWRLATAESGGQVWTKNLDNGMTAVVRVDPPAFGPGTRRPDPLGYADEVAHAHKEAVPTSEINAPQLDLTHEKFGQLAGEGNFWFNAPGKEIYDDANEPIAEPNSPAGRVAAHIPTSAIPAEASVPGQTAGAGASVPPKTLGDPFFAPVVRNQTLPALVDQNPPAGPPNPPTVQSGVQPPATGGGQNPPGGQQQPPPGVVENPPGPGPSGAPGGLQQPVPKPLAGALVGVAGPLIDCLVGGQSVDQCGVRVGLGGGLGAALAKLPPPASVAGATGPAAVVGAGVGFISCLSQGKSAPECMRDAAKAGTISAVCAYAGYATQNVVIGGACGAVIAAGLEGEAAWEAVNQAERAEAALKEQAEKNALDKQAFVRRVAELEQLVEGVESAGRQASQKCQQLDQLAAQARLGAGGTTSVACGPAAAIAARAKTDAAFKLLSVVRQLGATASQLSQQAQGRDARLDLGAFKSAYPAEGSLAQLIDTYVGGWRPRLDRAKKAACPAARIDAAAKDADAAAAAALKAQQQVKDPCPQPPAPPPQQQAANQPATPPSANKTPESRNCNDYCMSGVYSPAKGDAAFSSSGPLTGDVNACLQPAPLCDCPRIDRKLAGTEQQCQAAIDKVVNDKNSKVTSLGPPPAAAPSASNAAPPKPPAAPSGLPAGTPVEAGGVSAGLPPAGKPPGGGDEQKPIEIASISTVGEEQGHTPEPPPEKPIASVATTGEEQGHTAAEPANPPVAQTPPPAAGHIPAANATPERPVEGPRPAEKPANPSAPSQPATTAPVEKPAATAQAGHPPETAALVDKPPGQPPAHPATTAPLVDKPASAAPAAHPAQSAAVVDKPAAVQPGAGHPAETPALVDKPAGQPPSAHPATTAPLVDKPASTTTGTPSEADKQEAEKRKQEAAAEEKRKQEAAAAEEKRKQEAAAAEKRKQEQIAEEKRKQEAAAAEEKRKQDAAAAEKRKQEEEKQHKQAMLVDKPDQSIGQPAPPGPPLPVCKVGNVDFQNGQKVSNTLEVGANQWCTNKGFKPAGGSTTVVAAAKNGLAAAQGDHYTYKPNPNFKGADSFTVQRQWEEKGHASSATITYNVTVIEAPRQQAPVALAPPLPVCKVGNVDFQNGQKVSNTLEVGINQSCTNKGF
jgi:hypothetical protein